MPATYKDAGVDLDVYAESMRRLPQLMQRTFSPRVLPNEGGFAGLFQLDFPGKLFARDYRDPVLVSGTDGVGTKLKLAQLSGRHQSVGIDLVAMCVNDLICTGAEPLFFLDYIAMGKDDPQRLEQIVRGISDGCVMGDLALLGGETAIMPDMYGEQDYDLAGFAVGVVERKRLIDGRQICAGDVVLGLASSGLHSNGYSLVRKIIADAGLDWTIRPEALRNEPPQPETSPSGAAQPAGPDAVTLLEACLTPTRIYVDALRSVQQHYRVKQVIHGVAHITGGGLEENLDRILPANLDAELEPQAWPVPPIFTYLQSLGDVATAEMRRVFNMGIGMALVVSDFYAPSILAQLEKAGYQAYHIGRIASGSGRVRYLDSP